MPWVEIFRSRQRTDCEQRAFMLFALGIAAEILEQEDGFALLVASESAGMARAHLADSDAEGRRIEPVPLASRLHSHAWIGCLGYVSVLLLAAYCTGQHWFDRDWQTLGALRGTIARSGEWWRVLTALMLHADLAHLLANLGFGVFFGYFAGQTVGAGLAWFGTVIAAAFGNLIDAALMPVQQVSLGASTAVFATLGLLTAYSWKRHAHGRAKWAYRGAPLVAGIALLALTGSGGENTDVLAHLSGFAVGLGVGLLYAVTSLPDRSGWKLQWAAGAATVLLVSGAWWVALR
jgi:rhomboid protease GluP